MCIQIITNVSDLYKPEDGLVSIDVNNVDNELVKKLEEHCKKIAEEDIICYKVFTKVFATTRDGLSTVTYLTPFISVGLEMGVKYTAYGEVNFKERTKVKTVSGMSDFLITEINGGVFHSFIDEEDAKMFTHRFPFASISRLDEIIKHNSPNVEFMTYRRENVVVKCIIPKGTTYYEGSFNDGQLDCYASRHIFLVEETGYSTEDKSCYTKIIDR